MTKSSACGVLRDAVGLWGAMAQRAFFVWRTSWAGASAALLFGVGAGFLFPVRHVELTAVAGGAYIVASLLFLVWASALRLHRGEPLDLRGLTRVAVRERSTSLELLADGFASGALALLALGAGLTLGGWISG